MPLQSPQRFPESQNSLYPTRPAMDLGTKSRSIVEDVLDADWWATLNQTVWSKGCWKLACVAALFMVQGNLQYVASGNLSVPLFQLAYQLKVSEVGLGRGMCAVVLTLV